MADTSRGAGRGPALRGALRGALPAAGPSSGKGTEVSLPIRKELQGVPCFLNRVKKLILRDGYDTEEFRRRRPKLMKAFDGLDRALHRRDERLRGLRRWNRSLFKRKRAYQQVVHFLRIVKVPDKNLWKRLLPSLVFGQTKRQLEGAKPWRPPRIRKQRKPPSDRRIKTLPYVISFKNMLKGALQEEDEGKMVKLMRKFRSNLPFGSTTFLQKPIDQFHDLDKRKVELRTQRRKLDYCSWAPIGHGKRVRMDGPNGERFCTKYRRFIGPYRNPQKDKALQQEFEELREGRRFQSEEESEGEEW